MRRVYQVTSLSEGSLLLDLLDEAGIPAVLLNQNSPGALGELPVVYPEIWIRRNPDFEKALRVIDKYSVGVMPEFSVTCNRCGEKNLDNFEICWQCSHALQLD